MAAGQGKSGNDENGSADDSSKTRENRREFVSEAEEILERMFEDLSDLQEARHHNREIDPDLINRIFRSAHSLKGLAGMFGMDPISDLAHRLEDILDSLRLGRISLDSPVVVLLDDGIALLASLMATVEQGGGREADEDTQAAVATFIGQIEDAVRAPAEDPADDLEALGIEISLLRALTEYEEHRLRENLRRGRTIALVDTTFEIMVFEEGLSEVSEAVREVGEVISTLPSQGDAPASQIRFSLLVATDISVSELEGRLEIPNIEVKSIRPGSAVAAVPAPSSSTGVDAAEQSTTSEGSREFADDEDLALPKPRTADEAAVDAPVTVDDGKRPQKAKANPPVVSSPEPEPKPESTPPKYSAGEVGELASLRSLGETVRVDIRKLDQLMNLVGELVIQRNAIGEVVGRLSADPSTARLGVDLGKVHLMLARKLKELQAGVLDVRMVPMRQVFEKLSRVVRRLRRDLGKDVELEFSGADTELDKLIVEELVDPLVHLVRNAFDHAIESEADRVSAGKNPNGTISVRAIQRGNHVVVEVQDDGRGMNSSAIFAKAVERGLVTESDVLSERDLLGLVFEPGFSTCERVTATSGRGVGMDVVKSNLSAMGGSVELSSKSGLGTTVTITLPITLAIMQALIVEASGERFAIPLGSVLETLVIEPSEIERSEGREILNLRGEPLKLRRLAEELELDRIDRTTRQFVVVLGIGEQRIGLLVDRLSGQQDAVIKPIKGPIQQIRGIAGAAELGGANAILVIDVSSIVGDVARRREAA